MILPTHFDEKSFLKLCVGESTPRSHELTLKFCVLIAIVYILQINLDLGVYHRVPGMFCPKNWFRSIWLSPYWCGWLVFQCWHVLPLFVVNCLSHSIPRALFIKNPAKSFISIYFYSIWILLNEYWVLNNKGDSPWSIPRKSYIYTTIK